MAGVFVDTSQLNRLAVDLVKVTGTMGAATAEVIRKTAADIERDAKILCPVDTGFLRNSITTSFTGDGRTASMEAEIGPTAEYGRFVEEGTSTHAPQPYMGPAFDRHVPVMVSALELLTRDIL